LSKRGRLSNNREASLLHLVRAITLKDSVLSRFLENRKNSVLGHGDDPAKSSTK